MSGSHYTDLAEAQTPIGIPKFICYITDQPLKGGKGGYSVTVDKTTLKLGLVHLFTWGWVPQVWSLGGLCLLGHKPPPPPPQLLQAVPSRRSFGMAGGARDWVVGRAGLWGVLPTWVWVGGASPWLLGTRPPFAT